MGPTKIFRRTIFNSLSQKPSKGFTLIEMMIVLVIVGAVVTFALPKINGRENNIKSVARRISVLSRSVHNAARLSGRTYRIVFQMGDKNKQLYWVEASTSQGALVEPMSTEESRETGDNKEKRTSNFEIDYTIMKQPSELPGGLIFEDIELASQEKKATQGKAYIHYLPQGFTDEAAVHIGDGKELHWTLRVHPLTGQMETIGRYFTLKDVRAE